MFWAATRDRFPAPPNLFRCGNPWNDTRLNQCFVYETFNTKINNAFFCEKPARSAVLFCVFLVVKIPEFGAQNVFCGGKSGNFETVNVLFCVFCCCVNQNPCWVWNFLGLVDETWEPRFMTNEFGTCCLACSHRRLFFKNPACGGPIWTFSSKRNFFFKTELFFALRRKNVRVGREPIFQLHAALPGVSRMSVRQ